MNQKQMDEKQMFATTLNFLEKFRPSWSSIPVITENVTALKTIETKIEEVFEEQTDAAPGIGKTKAILKRSISENSDVLFNISGCYALRVNDKELQKQVDKNMSDLYRLKNEDFTLQIEKIIGIVNDNKEELTTNYGLTEELLNVVVVEFAEYKQIKDEPQAVRVQSTVATEELRRLFEDATGILTEQLDPLMKLFKKKEPNLYNGYLAARKTINH